MIELHVIVVVICKSELEDILEWLQWAKVAYKRDPKLLVSLT